MSYCHADEDWKTRAVGHLKALGSGVEVWHDRDIAKGDEWNPEIEGAMDRASVALLLVSKDFLSSTFIQEREVPYLLGRRKNAGLRVIPLFVRPCAWQLATWLSEIQGGPKDAKPLSGMTDHDADQFLADLAMEVRGWLQKDGEGSIEETPEGGAGIEPGVSTRLETPGFTPPSLRASPLRLDLGRLPIASPLLIGRESEMVQLDAAWEDPGIHVLTIVAFGGTGKSALVSHWLDRMAAVGWREARRVLDWSFYSQGTEERVTSADRFLDYALAWFGDPDPTAGAARDRGLRLAELVRQEKTLLVLDGVEPLQHSPGHPLAGC